MTSSGCRSFAGQCQAAGSDAEPAVVYDGGRPLPLAGRILCRWTRPFGGGGVMQAVRKTLPRSDNGRIELVPRIAELELQVAGRSNLNRSRAACAVCHSLRADRWLPGSPV